MFLRGRSARLWINSLKALGFTTFGLAGGYAYSSTKSTSAAPQNIHKALQFSATQVKEFLSQEEKNYDKVCAELKAMQLLLPKEKIKEAVQAMADQIAKQFHGEKHLLVLTMLQGANYFSTDLKRALHERDLLFKEDVIRIGRYGDSYSGGTPQVEYLPKPEQIIGRKILIIEDLIEQGVTLGWTIKELMKLGAKREDIYIAAFTDKIQARKTGYEHIKPNFSGFIMPENQWIVGYGCDQNKFLRAEPNLLVFPEAAQQKYGYR